MKKLKQKKRKKKGSHALLWIGILVVAIIAFFLFKPGSGSNVNAAGIDAFAKCLTQEGAVMYGAFWCPHCARTKKRFADSFEHITYVECDPRGPDEQSSLCLEKNIEAYDTWEFADGSRVIGEPSFEVLSEKTGCALP